jgi:uncharacterized protein YegL
MLFLPGWELHQIVTKVTCGLFFAEGKIKTLHTYIKTTFRASANFCTPPTTTNLKPKKKAMSDINATEIAYILDRSGSMGTLREAAVTAFNEFLGAQRAVPGAARLSLVLFDDAYEVRVDSVPLPEVTEMVAKDFVPRGSTALLDAIGRTILRIDAAMTARPEELRPGKVVVAVFTDGHENASREFDHRRVGDLIREFRSAKGWEFIFLAANQDAIASAGQLQMAADSSGNAEFTAAGLKRSMRAVSRRVASVRLRGTAHYREYAVMDDTKSLSELIREETEKED